MSKYMIRPDELLAELSKAYPQPRVRKEPEPVTPSVTFSNENLYGVVVYVVGEGVRGQYLRHEYFYREAERWWAIRLGWVVLYGRLKENGNVVPLVVMGLPTRFVFQFKAEDFAEYLLDENVVGYLEVKESQMMNLERCMQGKDPVLIIDKYGIVRQDGFATPSEMIEKLVEQQNIIEHLQRALWEYEKNIHELEASSQMIQAENAKLRELVRSFKSRFQKLASEITSVQMELIRLREDLKVRAKEIEVSGKAEEGLKNIVDKLEDLIEEFAEHLQTVTVAKKSIEKEEEGEESE